MSAAAYVALHGGHKVAAASSVSATCTVRENREEFDALKVSGTTPQCIGHTYMQLDHTVSRTHLRLCLYILNLHRVHERVGQKFFCFFLFTNFHQIWHIAAAIDAEQQVC